MVREYLNSFVIPWTVLVGLSFGLVYALSSSLGRLFEVDDLSGWLDETRVFRYALSMGLSFALHSLAIHGGLIHPQKVFHVRSGFREDGIRGYRIAMSWLVCLSLLNLFRQGAFVVHWGWLGEGLLSLLAMTMIVSVEHYIWRGWGLNEIVRIRGNFWPDGMVFQTWLPLFILTTGWVFQRAVFFGITQPRMIQSLFIEAFSLLYLTKILGFTGSWVFLILWASILHGVLGIPFLGIEMSGLLFIQPNDQRALSLDPMNSLIWWGFVPLVLALILAWLVTQMKNRFGRRY